jgi:hypothetical protein
LAINLIDKNEAQMENLKIISDTGNESQFQFTQIFDEQFIQIGKTIQEYYDYFVNKIDNEFTATEENFLEYKNNIDTQIEANYSKIIEILLHKEKEFNSIIKDIMIVSNDQITDIEKIINSKFNYIDSDLKDIHFNYDNLKISINSSLDKLGQLVESNTESINNLKLFNSVMEAENNKLKKELEIIKINNFNINKRKRNIFQRSIIKLLGLY